MSENQIFLIDLSFRVKKIYSGLKYYFFEHRNSGVFRSPELEKFFEQFHLEKWREENRKKLKNGAN